MKMLGSLRKKLKVGMTSEYLRENFMLVRKFYCIGLVSDFLQVSYWEGPFIIEEVYRSGAIKISSLKDNTTQVVNGQRLKHYIAGDSYNEDVDAFQVITPEKFIEDQIQRPIESVFK